ncbi:hypothetical protein ALC56_04013 [Trachymyrmex septentrionalis]|uniref:Uncharacterized protein n=1 Tax=Trachymyrmex septentrionalis TaxID=34720 RepID=A0A151JYT6_9HYME|nr:hypothetical protein ALC56_04013 [Trachymyrmex septentrionalis]
MSMLTFVDLQGFIVNKKFIVKKVAVLKQGTVLTHYIFTSPFPLGQPTIYIGEQCSELIGAAPNFNFDCVEGIIRCTVLPPRDLFHPVLPYRVQSKLLFGLCRSCCETFSQAECTHDLPADREFGGLFAEYINSFLKLKQEASGWPSECLDDESKEQYLREYEKTEGIVLDKNNIARNPGLRSVAKLCLNSFYQQEYSSRHADITSGISLPDPHSVVIICVEALKSNKEYEETLSRYRTRYLSKTSKSLRCQFRELQRLQKINEDEESADTLRDMQILRCKIPKRQDMRQYYSTELRHDTTQKHDMRQNLTINDEAVALADAVEFPRL